MRTLTSELASHAGKGATAPRVYADANLPVGLVAFMRTTLGWDVFFVMEHDDLRRAPDERHYQLAREMHRTLVTLDRDYTDDRRFPPAASGGVIVISAPDARRYEELLRRIDRRLLRPDHPDTLLPTLPRLTGEALSSSKGDGASGSTCDVSFDMPLAGRKLRAYSDWP